ncbi:MAG TPA: CHAT domain-containing protein [Kofleriaceae bacterium]
MGVVVAACAAVSCARDRSATTAACKSQLAAKTDAVTACVAAFANVASVDTARSLVLAYAARGDDALAALAARNPGGPIAAEIWHHRGNELRAAQEDDASLAAFERALVLRGSDPLGQARELLPIAQRYQTRGDMLTALAVEARAFDAAMRSGDPTAIARARVAFATELSVLGDTAGSARMLADAVEHLPADDAFLPAGLALQGSLEYQRGHRRLARDAWQRAEATNDPVTVGTAHRNRIDNALRAGDLAEASELVATDPVKETSMHALYEARVALARGDAAMATTWCERGLAKTEDVETRALLETTSGAALARQGNDSVAIAALERAIHAWDSELEQLQLDELKQWAQSDEDRRAPYEHLFGIYAREGRALDALAVAQQSSSRAFLDGLASRSVGETDESAAQVARVEGERAVALQHVARSLRASKRSRLPSAAELGAALRNAVVWTYVVADDEVWLVALDRGHETIDDLGPLAAIHADLDAAAAFDEGALGRLGDRLAPVPRWRDLDATTIVHIAVTAPLDRVPFVALNHAGRRWVEQAAFAYVPNAAVLVALGAERPHHDPAIVVGDPRGDLAGARAEAEGIAKRLAVPAQLGSAATTTRVLSAGDAELLAIASHADVTPGGASLRLADGNLTTGDIIDHGLAPSEAVLTSCASAATDADAWGALAGAFVAAGTPNVIASRWALDDAIGGQLVADFFAADGAHHPAIALAVTQRAAIAHQIPVAAWAALVALGTGESSTQAKETR